MSTPLAPATPGCVSVGSFTQAAKHKKKFDAILTLQDPGARISAQLVFMSGPVPARLVLEFEDFDHADRNVVVATRDQIAQVIAFGRTHAAGSLLVHCVHGIGRSVACALAILADRAGPGNEATAVARVFALRPNAAPNLVAVAIADDLLGSNGALIAALREWEAASPGMAVRRANRMDYYEKNAATFAHHPA